MRKFVSVFLSCGLLLTLFGCAGRSGNAKISGSSVPAALSSREPVTETSSEESFPRPYSDSEAVIQWEIMSIDFLSARVGFACTSGAMLKTADGGKHWTVVNRNIPLRDVQFLDEKNGYAMTSHFAKFDTFVKTTDGGAHWNPFKFANGWKIRTIDAVNDKVMFVTFEDVDGVFRTTDGGKTFTKVNLPKTEGLSGFSWISATEGYAASWKEKGFGSFWELKTLYFTENGGRTWTIKPKAFSQVNAGNFPLEGNEGNIEMQCVSKNTVFLWLSASSTLMKSTDSGATFKKIDDMGSKPCFVNNREGFAVMGTTYLIKTSDGGKSWSKVIDAKAFQSICGE